MQNSVTLDNHISPGFFKSQEEMMFFLLLSEIQKQKEPLGSWSLNALLAKQGVCVSTATIGRYLKVMDSDGLSIRKSNQGRIITEKGENWLQSITEHLARAEVHDEASIGLRVNEYTDLLDLIQARKTIEMETVRLAAVNATQDELWKLRQSVSLYYRDVAENKSHDDSAYNFHTIIAEMSRNKYFKYLLDIMIFEEQKMEERMDKLVTKERGNVYVVQHDDIVAALELRDADLAQQRMGAHIDTMLSDVKHQIEQIQALAKEDSVR